MCWEGNGYNPRQRRERKIISTTPEKAGEKEAQTFDIGGGKSQKPLRVTGRKREWVIEYINMSRTECIKEGTSDACRQSGNIKSSGGGHLRGDTGLG